MGLIIGFYSIGQQSVLVLLRILFDARIYYRMGGRLIVSSLS